VREGERETEREALTTRQSRRLSASIFSRFRSLVEVELSKPGEEKLR